MNPASSLNNPSLSFLSLCRDVRRAGVFGVLLMPPSSILLVHVDSSWRSIDVSVASRAAWLAALGASHMLLSPD